MTSFVPPMVQDGRDEAKRPCHLLGNHFIKKKLGKRNCDKWLCFLEALFMKRMCDVCRLKWVFGGGEKVGEVRAGGRAGATTPMYTPCSGYSFNLQLQLFTIMSKKL